MVSFSTPMRPSSPALSKATPSAGPDPIRPRRPRDSALQPGHERHDHPRARRRPRLHDRGNARRVQGRRRCVLCLGVVRRGRRVRAGRAQPRGAGRGLHRDRGNDVVPGRRGLGRGAAGTFLRIPAGVTHDFENRGAQRATAFNVFIADRPARCCFPWKRSSPASLVGRSLGTTCERQRRRIRSLSHLLNAGACSPEAVRPTRSAAGRSVLDLPGLAQSLHRVLDGQRTVVSIELSAPPPPIASATAAMDTLSGASSRL